MEMIILETERIIIRKMEIKDENPFIEGISDQDLRKNYGFPMEISQEKLTRIFFHFLYLDKCFSLIEKKTGNMVGFLLDVDLELPSELASALPKSGRTIAYAIFPTYQRKGYMTEALKSYIQLAKADFIHCGHFAFNKASKHLLQKLGFKEYSKHYVEDKLIIDEIYYEIHIL